MQCLKNIAPRDNKDFGKTFSRRGLERSGCAGINAMFKKDLFAKIIIARISDQKIFDVFKNHMLDSFASNIAERIGLAK